MKQDERVEGDMLMHSRVCWDVVLVGGVLVMRWSV